MKDIFSEERVSKIDSFNGIDLYHIGMGKFKTNTINIFFHDELSREYASENALVPAVLRRGCRSFPTSQDIALHLEEMYGATFDCGVTKKGERQIMQFYIEFVSDKYTEESSNLLEKSFDLLYEIITHPVLEKGAFREDYIQQEKVNLVKLIESRVNDKMQYAIDRCYEEMCSSEPFGVYDYGSAQDVEHINGKNLYERYKVFLKTFPIQVFVTGNIEEDEIRKIADKLKHIRDGQDNNLPHTLQIKEVKGVSPGSFDKEVEKVRSVTERMSITQGKLSLGFRTNTSPEGEDYYALLVYNGILGGGIHSKLFQNVREKASLAYYVFSRLEKFKGLMIISSGIEFVNRDKTIEIILKQMEEIRAGNISDYEFDATLKTIETGIKSLKDSQLQIVDYYLSQSIINSSVSYSTLIEKIKQVSKRDIIEISKRLKLDTIYFLTEGKE